MPTVTVSEETMDKIEKVQDEVDWKISKREIADRGINEYWDEELDL